MGMGPGVYGSGRRSYIYTHARSQGRLENSFWWMREMPRALSQSLAFNHVKDVRKEITKTLYVQREEGEGYIRSKTSHAHSYISIVAERCYLLLLFYTYAWPFSFYFFVLFPRRILLVFHYFDIYDDIIAPAVSLFAFLFPVFIFLLPRFVDHSSSSSFLFVLFPLLILGNFSVGTESNLPATG